MTKPLTLKYLADHPNLLPTLQLWFESEWATYYGTGGRGNAMQDLLSYSNRDKIPLALIAFREGELCGIAAIKSEPFPSHPHLFPWIGAGLVHSSLRRQGIGRELIQGLEVEARALGYERIYCATSTSNSLLERCAWQFIERVEHEGEQVSVYEKAV